MTLSALWLAEPLRALKMGDEYTFVVAKAALVVASTIGLVLSLAWVAAKKCFREGDHVAAHKSFSRPPQHAVEQPGISLTAAPSGSLQNLRRHLEWFRISLGDILSARRGLLHEWRLLQRLIKD